MSVIRWFDDRYCLICWLEAKKVRHAFPHDVWLFSSLPHNLDIMSCPRSFDAAAGKVSIIIHQPIIKSFQFQKEQATEGIQDLIDNVEKAHFRSSVKIKPGEENMDSIMKSIEKLTLTTDFLKNARILLRWQHFRILTSIEQILQNHMEDNSDLVTYIFKTWKMWPKILNWL